jgi:hypothetical protein
MVLAHTTRKHRKLLEGVKDWIATSVRRIGQRWQVLLLPVNTQLLEG